MAKRILFLGKAEHAGADEALHYLCERFEVQSVLGCRGDTLDDAVEQWEGDLIVSYLSPWIVPGRLLRAARMDAINFHPGPPEYPGIGCTNFALYNGETRFGVTCHRMAIPVDSGAICSVRRFAIADDETVNSLTLKCYAAIRELFMDVMTCFEKNELLVESGEFWSRPAYRRDELNALCRLTTKMDPAEVRRRVRATTFPGAPGAYLEISGLRFDYAGDPLAPVPLEES